MVTNFINHAVIMAAGRGNRMRPLTDKIPKSMVPYKGDTLIGNSLSILRHCVSFIHVTVGYKKAMLSEYLMKKGVDTIINTEGHGNAWWVSQSVLRYIDEPILVLTTDNITEIDIEFVSSEYQRLGKPLCMLIPVRPIQGIEGDYIYQNKGRVLSLDRQIIQDRYCSGIQVINPFEINHSFGQFDNFNDLWKVLIKNNHLFASEIYPKKWFSVDNLENLKKANNIIYDK